MEISMFVLGVLVPIAVIVVVTMVYGIVKIAGLMNYVQDLSNEIDSVRNSFYEELATTNRGLCKDVDNTNHKFESELREIRQDINDVKSYVDSRIDKAVTSKKQVIKG